MGGITKLIALVVSLPVAFVVFAQLLTQHAGVTSISDPAQSLFDAAPTLFVIAMGAIMVGTFAAVGIWIIRGR